MMDVPGEREKVLEMVRIPKRIREEYGNNRGYSNSTG